MAKPRKNRRQKNIEHFKQILDANLLAPVPGRDPKVKYFAPDAPNVPNVKLPGIPSIEELAPRPSVASDRKTDLAQYILARTSGLPVKTSYDITGKDGADQEEPGLLSKIFDTMSGPLYGSYQALGALHSEEDKSFMENLGDTVSGVAKGVGGGIIQTLSGLGSLGVPGFAQVEDSIEELGDKWAPEKFGHQILEEQGVDNKFAKYGLGFVMDVAADPLTYVPGIGFAKGAKKAKDAVAGMSAAEKVTAGAANPNLFKQGAKPKIREPRVTESLAGIGRHQQFDVPRVNVPGAGNPGRHSSVRPPVDKDFSWGGADAGLRALNDPVSMNASCLAWRSSKRGH